MNGQMITEQKIMLPSKRFKDRFVLDSDTWDPYVPIGWNVHKHPRRALLPPEEEEGEEEEEGMNLTMLQKTAEIIKGARGSLQWIVMKKAR
jgi:hypothetical protein